MANRDWQRTEEYRKAQSRRAKLLGFGKWMLGRHLSKETKQKISLKSRTHGMSRTRTYIAWQNMHRRCNGANEKYLKDYTIRGIVVCKRWGSFQNFFADMGEMPDGLSLNRIDNNGDYTPSNCEWTDRSAQQNNRRGNRLLSFNEATLTVKQWANKLGIKSDTLHTRLRLGWDIEKVLTEPVNINMRHKCAELKIR